MISRRILLAGGAALTGLSACGMTPTTSKLRTGQHPQVTSLVVQKSKRRLLLLDRGAEIASFGIALGRNPVGPKEREGDGRTPEGSYYITRLNPNSHYHLALGISYPSTLDVAHARARGVSPGGDIFIHGQPEGVTGAQRIQGDWTAGCIAVSNQEIERIYALVQPGTPILIQA
ncbi:ErfK/YbiS/YcfS/YnhG family protein [Rubellimicrobium mesophilum DSM 19309]|uniref:ErfK/YbiS/YcfS/YnhG family protein n=1 Tax=Rubellimicrobium mesophilum DSM 19309 TaxID=442562 RepID=A0A017HK94_9RHOB|nr:L,D-transpeptidase family protein [Rubellimicrobium mesophilum]EYD74786.1 ErfK/YbiS/YcfS/YnhG family protein [Rubellimicrobium mesophilum DSM 19309]